MTAQRRFIAKCYTRHASVFQCSVFAYLFSKVWKTIRRVSDIENNKYKNTAAVVCYFMVNKVVYVTNRLFNPRASTASTDDSFKAYNFFSGGAIFKTKPKVGSENRITVLVTKRQLKTFFI